MIKKKESSSVQTQSLQKVKAQQYQSTQQEKYQSNQPTQQVKSHSNISTLENPYVDDDHYEEDGFVIDDVDNCEELQMLIRQIVRPQGYDPELSISFSLCCIGSLISTEKLLKVQIIK